MHDHNSTQLPSDELKKEHEITLKVAGKVAEEVSWIRKQGRVDQARIKKYCEFFQNFTDRCHHAKEERFYFAAAKIIGDEQIQTDIARLEAEHTYFRAIMDQIDYLLEAQPHDIEQLAERLERYVALLTVHIQKEDRALFNDADTLLPPKEQQALRSAFQRIEKMELGEGFHERYHRLAEDLIG